MKAGYQVSSSTCRILQRDSETRGGTYDIGASSARELPELSTSIYHVDAPLSELLIPKNKGHEAMVYLTYIIDHYDELADTTIFLHPHRTTWHNNDLLDSDAVKTIQHLSDAHVARVGYFNTRCHHEPGCPIGYVSTALKKSSISIVRWKRDTLLPKSGMNSTLGFRCPRQFLSLAVHNSLLARDRVRQQPRSEYIRYRDWLLNTRLDDIMSGRVMEYSWQYLFTGKPELCPEMHVCYCDGYGICFGGPAEFQNWFNIREESRNLSGKAADLYNAGEHEKAKEAETQRTALESKLQELKIQAFERGRDPKKPCR
jgi:hypothetical protein